LVFQWPYGAAKRRRRQVDLPDEVAAAPRADEEIVEAALSGSGEE
jgi:hypothetical protein